MTDNYFRVVDANNVAGQPARFPELVGVFPFDSELEGTIESAWRLASSAHDARPSRRLAVYRPVDARGPWRGCPVAWWGLGAHFGSGVPVDDDQPEVTPAIAAAPVTFASVVRGATLRGTPAPDPCVRCPAKPSHFTNAGPMCSRHYREHLMEAA